MNKRDRLTRTIAGEATDRVPVSVWRHWPGDDQRAADLARSTIEFQRTFDWDFVKITPASSFSVTDYGVQDEWQGNIEGTRTYTRRSVYRSLDWTELRPLDPQRGALGRQIDCVRLVCDGLQADEVPVLQTIFNPLSQARHLAGDEVLIRHMRTHPDRVQTALNALTESTLRFLDALKKLPIAGIFYATQHASYDVMSEEEYRTFGLPYDRKILESLPERWWFNMMHLHGQAPMFKLCSQLPVQSINWDDQETEPTLAQGKLQFNGAVSGGLARWRHLHHGTPSAVREQARAAMAQCNNRRLILSAGCTLLVTTPLSNLRALRDVIEVTGN